MTILPALFQPDMVEAIIAGRKTQTRRTERAWARLKPGDLIYVCERHWRHGFWSATGEATASGRPEMTFTPTPGHSPAYSKPPDDLVGSARDRRDGVPAWFARPGMFHERQHSRITLVVTASREEWLHCITDADAIAEGVEALKGGVPQPSILFERLWRRINGDESWKKNPLVSVTTFRAVMRNIDAGPVVIDESGPVSLEVWRNAIA